MKDFENRATAGEVIELGVIGIAGALQSSGCANRNENLTCLRMSKSGRLNQ